MIKEDEAALVGPVFAAPPAHPPGDYAIVEILGHQTLIGRVEEVERFGFRMLRIEPIFCGVLLGPIYQSGGSLYRFSSCAAQDPGALETLEEADLARRRAAETPLLVDPRKFLAEDGDDADFADDLQDDVSP